VTSAGGAAGAPGAVSGAAGAVTGAASAAAATGAALSAKLAKAAPMLRRVPKPAVGVAALVAFTAILSARRRRR